MNLESLEKQLHAVKSRPGRTALLLLGFAALVIVRQLGGCYFAERGKQLAKQTARAGQASPDALRPAATASSSLAKATARPLIVTWVNRANARSSAALLEHRRRVFIQMLSRHFWYPSAGCRPPGGGARTVNCKHLRIAGHLGVGNVGGGLRRTQSRIRA